MTHLLMLLAQASQPSSGGQPSPALSSNLFFGLLLAALAFFWYWSWSSRKNERRKFEDMLGSLKRNDRVQTIGGILGTVVDVRDNEVVVKVDETNNTKIRFNRSAIKEVIREAQNGGTKTP